MNWKTEFIFERLVYSRGRSFRARTVHLKKHPFTPYLFNELILTPGILHFRLNVTLKMLKSQSVTRIINKVEKKRYQTNFLKYECNTIKILSNKCLSPFPFCTQNSLNQTRLKTTVHQYLRIPNDVFC